MDLTDPIQVLAGTAWGEARGGGVAGMQSVCNVVMNRANHPRWWGRDPLSVCLDPWQFSCWNETDPNRTKIMALNPASPDPDFATALGLAKQALAGGLHDITGGADSYYDAEMRTPPDWAGRAVFCATIAGQMFYRVELPAPQGRLDFVPNVRAKSVAEQVPGASVPAAANDAAPAPDFSADNLNQAELDRLADGEA